MKVLLAIDDSESSKAAVQTVIKQLPPQRTEVRLLHVVGPILFPPYWLAGRIEEIEAAERDAVEQGEKIVGHAEQLLAKAGFKVNSVVKKGEPRAVIVDYAAHWKADVIFVGSHGRKGLDRLLIGSVSEAVLHHAHCSVEIVRVPGGSRSPIPR
ncbi:MAG TPA: universal stress protein [Candidatus Polarisedimenticolia bacterium]|nr:universal stress protein [Candidatus Polarisedimenticolia bacterium]